MKYEPEQRIDEFQLISQVGAGGFSVVWKARHTGTQALHALKFPLVDELIHHLRQQAELADLVSDPQVVPIQQSRLTSQPPYLVMPWVTGRTLAMRSHPPKVDEMPQVVLGLERLADLAGIVGRLHRRSVVHGDLKPENVLVRPCGRCSLLDLGLAQVQVKTRQQRSLAQSLVSVDGRSIAGTLEYMAPELLVGAQPSQASDVYSLGVMLHQALTGRSPAFGVTPRSLNPYLPPRTEELLRHLLHHDPAERFASAAPLADELWRLVALERGCLEQRNGHARRAVWLGRMAVVKRGVKALGLVVALGLTLAFGLGNLSLLLNWWPDDLFVGTAIIAINFVVWVGLLLGITTINAWVLGVAEKRYKERRGHPLWTFMMQ